MTTAPSPDARQFHADWLIGGMYLLRVRCFGRPTVLRTRTQLVRGFSALGKGAIMLIHEERPWPIGGQRRIRYAMRIAGARMVTDRAGAKLLELEAASVWPLARPFHLSEVLSDVSAYGGPCPIMRLSNIHEQEIRRSALLGAQGLLFDHRKMDDEVQALFLRLWSKGKDAPDYDKGEWRDLRTMLDKRGILI